MNDDLDRQFERLLRNPLTRRRILQRGAAGAHERLGTRLPCRVRHRRAGGGGDNPDEAKAIPKGKVADSMFIANWPLYIDEERTSL